MADSLARAACALANHIDLKRLNMKVAPGVSAVNAKISLKTLTPGRGELQGEAFGDDQGDVIVLVVWAELPDLVDYGGAQLRARQFAILA